MILTRWALYSISDVTFKDSCYVNVSFYQGMLSFWTVVVTSDGICQQVNDIQYDLWHVKQSEGVYNATEYKIVGNSITGHLLHVVMPS